jgi:hypothetical protein
VGQTLTGIIGGYALKKAVQKLFQSNTFLGPKDLWYRGIIKRTVAEGDKVVVDGQISSFTQVFPGNPFENANRWDALYHIEGKIDQASYQSLEFVSGSDAALRIGSLNGETLVGIYDQYGFVGEGIIGVSSTSLLEKVIPDFRRPSFVGTRALIGGILKRSPSQHGYVIESIARKHHLQLDTSGYKNVYYLNVQWIRPYRPRDNYSTLLGSPWATTDRKKEQYIVRYAHISDPAEKLQRIEDMKKNPSWSSLRVFYDDIDAPGDDVRFGKLFL